MILQLCNLTHILERNRRLSVWSTHCSPGGAKLESLNKGDGSDNASSNMTINNYNEISNSFVTHNNTGKYIGIYIYIYI